MLERICYYMIECRTGCTCCSSENHYRGFYKTKKDAEHRVKYFLSKDSEFWPVASQYASRGNYDIQKAILEDLNNGRFILNNDEIIYNVGFVVVNEDGTVDNNNEEVLHDVMS